VPRLRLNAVSSQNWTTPANIMPDTIPLYQQGAVYYANAEGLLQAVDFQTGATIWTATSINPSPLQSPIWINGLLYLATDEGQLYAISPVTGNQIWSGPVTLNSGNPLSTPQSGIGYVNGAGQQSVLYVMDAQNIYLVPLTGQNGGPPTPQTVYTAPSGVTLATSLIYDSTTGYMVVNTSNGLSALQANIAGTGLWPQAWEAALGGYVTPATSAMGKLFVGTPAQAMAIVDIATGSSIASASLNANIEQPVLVYPASNTAFVPTDSGRIVMLDATSASQTNQIQPGGQVTTPLTLGDNLVYYGSADSNVYSFDITEPTGNVVSYLAEAPINYMAGVSAASAYFGTSSNMHSADFAEVIHEFNSQSQLMVDFVPSSGANPQQIPSYQSHITLYDTENNIRPNEAVKIWSVTPATLLTENQTFQIGPTTPAAFTSDASGKVVLSVPASTTIQGGVGSGLSTPALMLWASFMDPNERILIYPDQRLHARLQTMSGTDLQNAAAYNSTNPTQPGAALLPAGFQGSQGLSNANALASAINNSIAIQSPTATVGAVSTQYLAFPQSMLGVQYCPTPPNPTRTPAPGTYPNWTLDLSTAGSATFTPTASAEEAQRVANSFRAAKGLSPAGGIFSDIADFIENVINGIENVVLTVWQAAENAVTAVIHTVESTYNLVVTTIEDAAHVVLGILKSIVQDVENAVESIIEALSWLFDWNDILNTHSQIKTMINNGFSETITLIGTLQTEADGFFDNLKTTITNDFSTLISQVSGTTLGGSTANYSDPNQAYTQGSDNYSVQGNYMYHKSMTGALGPNGSVSVGGSTMALALPGMQESLSDAVTQFLEAVGADALEIAEDLGALVVSAINELVAVIANATQARAAGLAALLTNIQNLLLDLVQLGQDATDAFFTMVQAVVQLVQTALNTSIDIPLISDLYEWLTGDQLTILDLFSLIVAIPTTIVYKAITGSAPFSSSEEKALASSSLSVQNMIVTFTGIIYALVDAVSNAMGSESPAFLNYVEAVLIAIPQAIGTPYEYSGDQLRDYGLLWLYEWFPVIWGAHCGMEQGAGNPTSNAVLPFHGIGTFIWDGVYAIMYPADFFDNGIKLAQNELGALSTIAGFMKLSENPEVLIVLVPVGFFLDMGNALIEIKYWWS